MAVDKAKRILIVDDDRQIRTLLVRVLKVRGWRNIEEAANAVEAQKMIEVSTFDLIISDWDMPPGMSGLALLKTVRNDPALAGLPFILMSGDLTNERRYEAADARVSHLFTKPFATLSEFVAKVEKLLS